MAELEFPDAVPEPEAPKQPLIVLTREQKVALVGLGGLFLVAFTLSALLRARRSRGNDLVGLVSLPESGPAPSADLVASIRHLAAAVDDRMQGFQQQLDALHQAVGTAGPLPEPTPTINPFNSNGREPANQSYEAAIAEQPENIPPSPAATSLP